MFMLLHGRPQPAACGLVRNFSPAIRRSAFFFADIAYALRSCRNVLALRIDVHLPPRTVEREIAALDRRLRDPDDILYDLDCIPVDYPGMVFRHREANGEHYVYAINARTGRLAGYTVFNRLIELNRKQDKHLRAAHSKYARAYQRLGIATAVYRWWLDGGRCLITGARQSRGANVLWQSLGKRYTLFHVDLRDKQLSFLGRRIDSHTRQQLQTRMILAGKGWSTQRLAAAIGMPTPQIPDMQHIRITEDTGEKTAGIRST